MSTSLRSHLIHCPCAYFGRLWYKKYEHCKDFPQMQLSYNITPVYCCIMLSMNFFHLQNGKTPLYIASQEGHYTVVQILIIAKADVNHPNEVGYV